MSQGGEVGVHAERGILYDRLRQRRRWKAHKPADIRRKLGLEATMSLDTLLACLDALRADGKVKVNKRKGFSIFVCP